MSLRPLDVASRVAITGSVPSSICSEPDIELQLADPSMSGTTSWTFPLRSDIRLVTGMGVDSQTKCSMHRYTDPCRRRTCPNIEIRLSRILLQMLRCWIWLITDTFDTKSNHRIPMIRLKHHNEPSPVKRSSEWVTAISCILEARTARNWYYSWVVWWTLKANGLFRCQR